MIEVDGVFIRDKSVLRFVCPCCGRFEERPTQIRVTTGSTLKTMCGEKKTGVLVIVERCV